MNLLQLLLDFVNSERYGSTDRMIAEYILIHIDQLAKMSSSDIALACNVSRATISRFCKRIGLMDFYQLKNINYHPNSDYLDKFFFLVNEEKNYAKNYLKKMQDSIQKIQSSLDLMTLEKIIYDIQSYKRVYLMGAMQSSKIAQSLQSLLMINGKFVNSISTLNDSKRILLESSHDDLFIIFSMSGKFFERIFSGNEYLRKKDRPKIYMITTNADMYQSSYARHIIQLPSHGSLSSAAIMQIYVDLIALTFFKMQRE